ncbi:MAG: helicase RepA family protein [Methylacidiphilales bacterium]|nr:helicase RepA family protein [Candidatus Methylacidiphilales bacterium]
MKGETLNETESELIEAMPDCEDVPTARDAIDLVNDVELVEPPILVAGLLHKGSTLLLGASSKSFKSWSLIDLALSVASGREWWNLSCTKGRVLYADFELTPFFWRKRAMEIAEARNLTLDNIRVMNCRGYEACAALLAIEREAQSQPFDLILLDPLYSFLAGRDENSAGDVGLILRRLAMLAESTGAALAISHHFSKGNQSAKEAIDRFSGSGVFARFPDALLTMTRHEEDGAFVVDATVRNFAPINPFVLRWQHPLMARDGSLNPADIKKPPGSFQTKYTLEQVLSVMGSKVMTAKEVELACRDTHKMGDSTVKRLLKKGKEDGKVIQPSAGLWQRVTGSQP